MTVNSPNPFVGDVQALIADCLNDIEEIQYEISTYGDESGRRASKLKRQQVALAALTVSPVGWTDAQELRDVEKDGCGYIFSANPITPHADERRVILLYPNLLANILAVAPDNFGKSGPI